MDNVKRFKGIIILLVLGVSLWSCLPASAREYSFNKNPQYDTYGTQNINHNGLYLGAGMGLEIPTGPDLDGFATGAGWTFRIGYQFIRNLAIELGYHQSLGGFALSGASGNWSFLELPFFDVKPMIPLTVNSDLYFIVGVAYADDSLSVSSPVNVTITLGPSFGFDLGMGYEHYIGAHISLGGEVIYHNLTATNVSSSLGGSSTLSSAANGSSTSVNFAFLYHF